MLEIIIYYAAGHYSSPVKTGNKIKFRKYAKE